MLEVYAEESVRFEDFKREEYPAYVEAIDEHLSHLKRAQVWAVSLASKASGHAKAEYEQAVADLRREVENVLKMRKYFAA